MRRLAATLLSVALLCSGARARGDERMPSSLDCPEGSDPQSVHGPAECVPSECADEGDCKGGYTCVERALCVQGRAGSISGPGFTGGDKMSSKTATKACSGEGSCTYPTYCETRKRCVKQSSRARLKQTCGCSVVGAADGADPAVAAAVLLALAAASRRRRVA
jgi:MYXO-CTERM domain-containing protein